jgi:Tfp pilus assembly protein PilF
VNIDMMLRFAGSLALTLATLAPVAHADARSDAKEWVTFGIEVAHRGLWREAIFRWERAVEIDPSYAAAYNDLAVGYEHEGELDKARQAYEKALELEPNNIHIRQNYELFREINDRDGSSSEDRP